MYVSSKDFPKNSCKDSLTHPLIFDASSISLVYHYTIQHHPHRNAGITSEEDQLTCSPAFSYLLEPKYLPTPIVSVAPDDILTLQGQQI